MMENDFKRISDWLTLYAPGIINSSLNPPATDDDLADLEEITGVSLPDDFKELYRWHNGLNDEENLGNFFYGLHFYPIEFIVEEYESIDRDEPPVELVNYSPEIDPSNIYNDKWLIFATDTDTCFLILDMAPAEGGTVGQVIFIDIEENVGILVARSITELVATFADDLARDYYYPLEEAAEDGHDFLEVVDEIDLVNWWTSDRWKDRLEGVDFSGEYEYVYEEE